MRVRGSLFLILACLALRTPVAAAQLHNSNVFLGYSRSGSDLFYRNTGGLNGFDAALQVPIKKPFLGVEADLAEYGLGADSSTPNSTTFLAGPRVTVKAPLGVRLWAHGLVGGERSAIGGGASISGASMIYAIGGGADIRILHFLAGRIGADRMASPALSPASGRRDRFSTGLVFRF
jgi:hypothetical protein